MLPGPAPEEFNTGGIWMLRLSKAIVSRFLPPILHRPHMTEARREFFPSYSAHSSLSLIAAAGPPELHKKSPNSETVGTEGGTGTEVCKGKGRKSLGHCWQTPLAYILPVAYVPVPLYT